MGRLLVREESLEKLWKRSRLWGYDSFSVLKQKKGTENVLGLSLDMRMFEKEKLHVSLELTTEALTIHNDFIRSYSNCLDHAQKTKGCLDR
ncbi:hypothetical protein L2E82_30194 [Cichorium intybus]|uniref:Uncharacterized protein n=1 Tax=Cichorium intybus TaxID=13427 RepID=A0ACB9D003_CICIN|nr:hypothetical protein L2E82_30194 [Cichorium intybus]